MIAYSVGDSQEKLIFMPDVLSHFAKYQQKSCWSREAGGPMFVASKGGNHEVLIVGGPFFFDKRSRNGFFPHRKSTQNFIDYQFKLGNDYIGSWHSHPEFMPKPSDTDMITMKELFTSSKHQLNAFIYVIVGTGPLPFCLHVCAWTHNGYVELRRVSHSPVMI